MSSSRMVSMVPLSADRASRPDSPLERAITRTCVSDHRHTFWAPGSCSPGAVPVPDRALRSVCPNGTPVMVARRSSRCLPGLLRSPDQRRGVCGCFSRRAPNSSTGAAAAALRSPWLRSPRSGAPRGCGGRNGEWGLCRIGFFCRSQRRTRGARRTAGGRAATVAGRRQCPDDPSLGGGDGGHQPDLRVRRGRARLRPRGDRRPARHVAGLDHAAACATPRRRGEPRRPAVGPIPTGPCRPSWTKKG